MKVLVFGATGMVGQGVLRECLLDPDVAVVQTVGRTATVVQHTKLREIVQKGSLPILRRRSGLVRLRCVFLLSGRVLGRHEGSRL
jgi:uncharacterized protein YbjT (DUF2867 family)